MADQPCDRRSNCVLSWCFTGPRDFRTIWKKWILTICGQKRGRESSWHMSVLIKEKWQYWLNSGSERKDETNLVFGKVNLMDDIRFGFLLTKMATTSLPVFIPIFYDQVPSVSCINCVPFTSTNETNSL